MTRALWILESGDVDRRGLSCCFELTVHSLVGAEGLGDFQPMDDFELTKEEADLIKRHLNRIVQIDRQMANLRGELEAECDLLEVAWQNAYRRNLLDDLQQGAEIKQDDFQRI